MIETVHSEKLLIVFRIEAAVLGTLAAEAGQIDRVMHTSSERRQDNPATDKAAADPCNSCKPHITETSTSVHLINFAAAINVK